MVWDGGSEPLVVPTRPDLLGVALGMAPVWPCSGGEGLMEKSVGRRPPCYLPLGQLILSPTVFNMVVDAVVRHWEMVMVEGVEYWGER